MTPQEAETQARELARLLQVPKPEANSAEYTKWNDNFKRLHNLIIKAGERDELKQLVTALFYAIDFYPSDDGYRAKKILGTRTAKEVLDEFYKERNSLREKLELAEEQIKNLRKDSDYCNFTKQQLDEQRVYAVNERNLAQGELKEMAKTPQVDAAIGTPHQLTRLIELNKKLERNLNVAQADCAVKFEALSKVKANYIEYGTSSQVNIACHVDLALSANPGQSLLDELKLTKEKAEIVDWIENHEFRIGWPTPQDNSFWIWVDDKEAEAGYREYNGKTLVEAVSLARSAK